MVYFDPPCAGCFPGGTGVAPACSSPSVASVRDDFVLAPIDSAV